MSSQKRVTLTMVAESAGTSIASVSRVIHTPHLTSNPLKNKIYKAIKKLNYQPDQLLKTHIKSDELSYKILVIDNQYDGFSNINLGIQHEAELKGYKLLYLRFYFFDQDEIQQIISYTINHNVDGILLINDSFYSNNLLKYSHNLPPIVMVNQFKLSTPSLYFDHVLMGFQATQHLIQNRHKQIILLTTKSNLSSSQQLENGYRQAYKRSNLAINPDLIIHDSHKREYLEKQLHYLLSQQDAPSAIICGDLGELSHQDRISSSNEEGSIHLQLIDQLLMILEEMKLTIPSEISLIYLNSYNGNSVQSKKRGLSFFYKPHYKMGVESVKLLLETISNPQTVKHSVLIESHFNELYSVKKKII